LLRRLLERLLLRIWFGHGPGPATGRLLLMPLTFITARISRRGRDQIRALPRPPLPVVVIGNLVAGGAGKTPLVIAMARQLSARGWRVGLLASGYRARRSEARLVRADDDAQEHGDEPVLLAFSTGLPVAAGRFRDEALHRLMQAHPDLSVVLADDGLQHTRLPRSLELVVFDTRGVGNGCLLPAGPLREPIDHARQMDALMLNGDAQAPDSLDRLPSFRFRAIPDRFRPVSSATPALDARAFQAQLAARSHGGLLALAGIAQPERFFQALRALGIVPTRYGSLDDHATIDPEFLAAQPEAIIVMTGKDAVKCRSFADSRCWWLDLDTECDPAFINWLEEQLGRSTARHSGLPDL
jgi:tetraacyldisaccharide 4'-kinase